MKWDFSEDWEAIKSSPVEMGFAHGWRNSGNLFGFPLPTA